LLRGRADGDVVECPWARIFVCDGSCRCGGIGMVTVGFLREHYRRLPVEIVELTRRVPPSSAPLAWRTSHVDSVALPQARPDSVNSASKLSKSRIRKKTKGTSLCGEESR